MKENFAIRAQIIWAKERLVIGRGDYHWQHEPCWYAVRTKGHWVGDRKQTTLWTIPSGGQDAETQHGTQKPVECMRRPMLNHTAPGDAVYDPFLGSGTTLIAAESTGRICLAAELDQRYVDVAIRRWQAFTGAKATLLADGRAFDDVARVRLTGPTQAKPCGQSPTPADMAVKESKAREGRKAGTPKNRSATCASARPGTSEVPRKRGGNRRGVEPKPAAAIAPAPPPRGTAGGS